MKIPVLDHGYVTLVESWGSDERIIEAARMSTNKGFKGWGGKAKDLNQCRCLYDPCGCPDVVGDEKLLRYLYTHKHMTPFEMGGLIIEVQAPIFVFREWHRHRTQSYNEMSARYTPIPDVNYVPTEERLYEAGNSSKQSLRVDNASDLTDEAVERFLRRLKASYNEAENLYQDALKSGVPKELARIILPVGRYSRMRASANLRNWLAFLTLRMDEGAQWEIRQYANVVAKLVSDCFPRTYELFQENA